MQWKGDQDEMTSDPEQTDPYYEDDGYASFAEEGAQKGGSLGRNPVRFLYWGLGIAVIAGVVMLVVMLFPYINESVGAARIQELEETVHQLQLQLDKLAGDEKGSRIEEQAKELETLKARLDRSEASLSLRMDHLAMSLDALQKKTDETLTKVTTFEKPAATPPAASAPVAARPAAAKTHTVVAGDTLFSISQRYNLSVVKLKAINGLNEGTVIHVGQKLNVSLPAEKK